MDLTPVPRARLPDTPLKPYKRVRALRVRAILLSLWTWRHGNAAAGVKDCDKHGRTSGRAVDQAYRAILIELMALLEEGGCRI